LAFWLRAYLPFGISYAQTQSDWLTFAGASLIYPIIYIFAGLYDPERTYRTVDELQIFTLATVIAALALAGLMHFILPGHSRLFLVYFYIVQFVLMCIWQIVARLILHRTFQHEGTQHRVLLVGGGETAQQVMERMAQLNASGVSFIGYLADTSATANVPEIPHLGRLADLSTVLAHEDVDDVLLAMPPESYHEVQRLMQVLASKPCNVWVVPDYFSILLYGSRVATLSGVPMISLKGPTLSGYQRVVKRAFDLVLGIMLTLVAMPIMIITAAAIKLSSPGPVLYRQQRVGENGKPFGMIKFRSMVVGADKHESKLLRRDEKGRLIHAKSADDPRITSVGRLIRRTSIDELPQLFNVLLGDMSLVGPRPELPALVEQYEPWQRTRFAVPQGMTGWWQVNGRSDKPTHEKVADDLYYVQNYSLLLDLRILLKTLLVVLAGRGAY
jgi:exopolysaccharide biosynthesis polyprenyl glycosylphosphotransferase